MKQSLALLTFVFAVGMFTNANAAGNSVVIHYADSGTTTQKYAMTISQGHATGKLDDLADFSDMDSNACYEGPVEDVCAVLEVAALDLSAQSKEKYKLECAPGRENAKYINWSAENNRSKHDDRHDRIHGTIAPCRD